MENYKKKKVYISGQVTGIEEQAAHFFQSAEDYINSKEILEAVNPLKLDHSKHDKKWESYMRVCIAALMECDYILMLENWHDSEGAKLEYQIALHVGIKVFS